MSARMLLAIVLLAPITLAAQVPPDDPKPAPPPVSLGPGDMDSEWDRLRAADATGDAEGRQRALNELTRIRAERNIERFQEPSLALVAMGRQKLAGGDTAGARADFEMARRFDPHSIDARLGLSDAEGGGFVGRIAALVQHWRGSEGGAHLRLLLTLGGVVGATLFIGVYALMMMLRYGKLLHHDLQEQFGPTSNVLALGVFSLLMLLPMAALQGWAWVPVWWLGVLFVYMSQMERVVSGLSAVALVAIGPAVITVEERVQLDRNPLYHASLHTLDGGPNDGYLALLQQASAADAEDRDLQYLAAIQHKKAGQWPQAEAVYRTLLSADPSDAIALNNVANLEVARGELETAVSRYQAVADGGGSDTFRATALYNLAVVRLKQFDFEAASAVREVADDTDAALGQRLDRLWSFDKDGSSVQSVVDLALTAEEVEAKFAGAAEGAGLPNVVGSAPPASLSAAAGLQNRFAGAIVLMIVAFIALRSWRGHRLFTLQCPKCGTVFCRRCHLGAVAASLCSQCYHMFVVKDGVAAQARRHKLVEVESEDSRKRRVFALISILSPGAGHVWAQQTLFGVILMDLWYGSLGLALVATLGPVAVSAAPGSMTTGAVLIPLGLIAIAVFAIANMVRPSFAVAMPRVRRGGRARAA